MTPRHETLISHEKKLSRDQQEQRSATAVAFSVLFARLVL